MARSNQNDNLGDTEYARTSYQVELHFPINRAMSYRVPVPGEPTVADILKPGRIVCTNYHSGPYQVQEVTENVWRRKRTWDVKCCDYAKAKPRLGSSAYLNEYVAIGGRIVALFDNNDDEIFVLPYDLAFVKWGEWIAANLPRHTTFVQPYGGLINLLLAKPRCGTEVFNEGFVPTLSSWTLYLDALPGLGPLLQGVEIVGMTPEAVMRKYDGHHTLHFIEADAVPEHDSLASFIDTLDGMVVVVTTNARLAKHLYPGWRCLSKRLVTSERATNPIEHFLLLSPSCPKLTLAFKSHATRLTSTAMNSASV